MSIVKLDQRACRAIIAELLERNLPLSVRIEICSTGCCDASLGLRPDETNTGDLVEEVFDLKFFISQEVNALVGDVSISYVDENGRKAFMITSQHPLNEWDGFAVCSLK